MCFHIVLSQLFQILFELKKGEIIPNTIDLKPEKAFFQFFRHC
jgi:hypothetical protein